MSQISSDPLDLLKELPPDFKFLQTRWNELPYTPHRYLCIDHLGLKPQKGTRAKFRKNRKQHFQKRGDRYYEIQNGTALPVLFCHEVPLFFYNRFVRHRKPNFHYQTAAVQESLSLCRGFSREDARFLLGLIQEQTRITASQQEQSVDHLPGFQCDDLCLDSRNHVRHTHEHPRQNSSHHMNCQSRDQSLDSQNQTVLPKEYQLELEIRILHKASLENFKRELLKRQQNPGITDFDALIPQMLGLIGSDGEWPWGTCCTDLKSTNYDYLACSRTELLARLRSGATMSCVPHVVRNDISDIDPRTDDLFLSKLKQLHKHESESIEVRDFSVGQQQQQDDEEEADERQNPKVSWSTLQSRYQKSQNTPSFTDVNLPLNGLDFWNITMPMSAILSSHQRYEGIQVAGRWVAGRGTGKSSYSYSSTVQACTSFNLFSLRGAFSGPHLDIYGGTIVTCLSGLKAWFIHTIRDPSDPSHSHDIEDFRQAGPSWQPKKVFKLILLRPGDTLIMPPGATMIHAPITIETSVMSGGMFIDLQQLSWHARHVAFLIHNHKMTNEYISEDFPDLWQKLEQVGIEGGQTDFKDASKALRDSLSCSCLGKKGSPKRCSPSSCPCLSRSLLKHCTVMCHKSPGKCTAG